MRGDLQIDAVPWVEELEEEEAATREGRKKMAELLTHFKGWCDESETLRSPSTIFSPSSDLFHRPSLSHYWTDGGKGRKVERFNPHLY